MSQILQLTDIDLKLTMTNMFKNKEKKIKRDTMNFYIFKNWNLNKK